MAYFNKDAFPWSLLDFVMLRNGGVTAYHAEAVLTEDIRWFDQQGYDIRHFDGHAWKDESAFHQHIAHALEFPSYYSQKSGCVQ